MLGDYEYSEVKVKHFLNENVPEKHRTVTITSRIYCAGVCEDCELSETEEEHPVENVHYPTLCYEMRRMLYHYGIKEDPNWLGENRRIIWEFICDPTEHVYDETVFDPIAMGR